MTREELIYDVIEILTGSGFTDDSRLDPDYIGYKIDQKRAKEIRDTYKRQPVIDPIWLQDYAIFNLTKVTKSEDSTIAHCDCTFSKAFLPEVVSIDDPMSNRTDIGTHSIRSSCGTNEFYYRNLSQMTLIQPGTIESKINCYIKIGNAIYLTPIVEKARAVLILENPLDGYLNDNTDRKSGELIEGTTYKVRSGQITYNSVKYEKDETFIATSTSTFTGNGKVVLNVTLRRVLNTDPYPMSHTMSEVVIKKILTEDFEIEKRNVSDIENDSQDELRENKV